MIFGRPVDLWINAVQALWAVLAVLANIPGSPFTGLAVYLTPIVWGVVALALAAVGALAAYQPPSVNVGDRYTVVTPGDAPNVEKVANANPTPPANLIPK